MFIESKRMDDVTRVENDVRPGVRLPNPKIIFFLEIF